MSKPLRVAVVVEGPTDGVVIHAALEAILQGRSFVLTRLFPETSAAFGTLGTGWAGVYRWCHASAKRGGGTLSQDRLLFSLGRYDLLIIHLDADVAAEKYANNSITPMASDLPLPCDKPCPPPKDTVNELQKVLLSWCGETSVPSRTVLCIPSKSTEAWVMAALFPQDREMLRTGPGKGWECHPDPASRLAQQPKGMRISKKEVQYKEKQPDITAAWSGICGYMTEAARFSTDFTKAVTALP